MVAATGVELAWDCACAGEKVKSWFSDMTRDDDDRYGSSRGARGLGPKGYKRSDERISDEVHQRLTDDGLVPIGGTREQFAAHIKSEITKWANVIKLSGARVD